MQLKTKIGLFLSLGVILFIAFYIIKILNNPILPIPSATEFYEFEAYEINSAYKAALSTHKNLIPTDKLIDIDDGDIDWVCVSKECYHYSAPKICMSESAKCIEYTGGIVAYSTKQILDRRNKNVFVNFTVLPIETEDPPASILLFGDGRILSGSQYKIGSQAAHGLEIIKTDPEYIRK